MGNHASIAVVCDRRLDADVLADALAEATGARVVAGTRLGRRMPGIAALAIVDGGAWDRVGAELVARWPEAVVVRLGDDPTWPGPSIPATAPLDDVIGRVAATLESGAWPEDTGAVDGFGLTARELEVVRALVDLGELEPAAAALGISANTLRTHVQRIMVKTQTSSRGAAIDAVRRLW